mmetsp:Transcript_40052/g.97254  ORF Transcript_40052/g.97254 Transcript_40052/m.97254 type:complete len:239 (-) Transcript_40052:93-809(-)
MCMEQDIFALWNKMVERSRRTCCFARHGLGQCARLPVPVSCICATYPQLNHERLAHPMSDCRNIVSLPRLEEHRVPPSHRVHDRLAIRPSDELAAGDAILLGVRQEDRHREQRPTVAVPRFVQPTPYRVGVELDAPEPQLQRGVVAVAGLRAHRAQQFVVQKRPARLEVGILVQVRGDVLARVPHVVAAPVQRRAKLAWGEWVLTADARRRLEALLHLLAAEELRDDARRRVLRRRPP